VSLQVSKRSCILLIKVEVCPLSLQLSLTISIKSLKSLSTIIWKKPCSLAICKLMYILKISAWRNHKFQSFEYILSTSNRLNPDIDHHILHHSLNLASYIRFKFYLIPLRMLLVDINSLMLPLPSRQKRMTMSIDLIYYMKNDLDMIIWMLQIIIKNIFVSPSPKVPTCHHDVYLFLLIFGVGCVLCWLCVFCGSLFTFTSHGMLPTISPHDVSQQANLIDDQYPWPKINNIIAFHMAWCST